MFNGIKVHKTLKFPVENVVIFALQPLKNQSNQNKKKISIQNKTLRDSFLFVETGGFLVFNHLNRLV